VQTQCFEEHVTGSSGQDQARESTTTAVVRPQEGEEDATGSIDQAAGGAMPMPSPWDGGDAAVATGPGWSPHAMQRVRRAVQSWLPGAGVPATEQPQLFPGTVLQHPSPPCRTDVSPPQGVGRDLPGRQRRRVMKKGINNMMIRHFSFFFLIGLV
jgi:hypothetical protein